MTNADKYLKDGVDYHDLACKIAIYMSNAIGSGYVRLIDEFFKQPAKPTLTEDEKVILRNVDESEYQYISRNKDGALFLNYKAEVNGLEIRDTSYMFGTVFCNHLFQFIQPRRRI